MKNKETESEPEKKKPTLKNERERVGEGQREGERRGKCPKIETNSRGEMEIQVDLKGGVKKSKTEE